MKPRTVMGAAAVVAAAALVGGSVATTGALWSDQERVAGASVNTGFLDLTPGARNGSAYTFAELTKANVVVDQPVSAVLVVRNTGSAPLRFRLNAAGPVVSTSGASVVVQISGGFMTDGAICGVTTLQPAFATLTTSAPTTPAVNPAWQSIAKGGNRSICVTTLLKSVTGPQPATYTHRFSFGAEST